MSALTEFSENRVTTPQGEKARDDQVVNNAGGFVFSIGPWEAFKRFLVLGTEGGTYYASQKSHTVQAVDSLKACAKEDGIRAVDLVTEISVAGRGIKNDQAIFALAYLASVDDDKVRAYALSKLNDVCRIGTHLFQFAEFVQTNRGWGRGLRNAVANWYETKNVDQVAYQATKYGQRNGWSHRDLLRLAHPNMNHTPGESDVAKFITNPESYSVGDHTPAIIEGFVKIREAKTVDEAATIIRNSNLTHDMVPTEFKGDAKTWEALLDVGIPYNALIRNLGVMSKNGILKPMGGRTSEVVSQLLDENRIEKSRIHPLAVLFAKSTYASGQGYRGQSSWTVNQAVNDALEEVFYKAFGNVEPANKRTLIGLDVSGSMGGSYFGSSIAGTNISPREASAAMAMVTVRSEPVTHVMAFSGGFVPLDISSKDSLGDVVSKTSRLPFDRTDCAQPMVYASQHNLEVDTFIVYTDNETWAGRLHPFQALKHYRGQSGINAKLVVVGMTATEFSIADPSDAGMLDVVGFDTASPQLISDFSAGNI